MPLTRRRIALKRAARWIPGFFCMQDTFDLWISLIPELSPNFALLWTERKSSTNTSGEEPVRLLIHNGE